MLISHNDTSDLTRRPGVRGVPHTSPPPLRKTPLIVLANRAPFRHERHADGRSSAVRSSGGLVTAIEPLIQAQSGTWVAHGDDSDLETADARGRVGVRSGRSRYQFRYVPCSPDEDQGFYCGFANEALWPLCHAAHVHPTFRTSDFRHYEIANRRFAAAVCEESPRPRTAGLRAGLSLRARTDDDSSRPSRQYDRLVLAHPLASRAGLPDVSLGRHAGGGHARQRHRRTADRRRLPALSRGRGNARLVRRRHRTAVIRYQGRRIRVRAYPVGVQWDSEAVQALPPSDTCRAQVAGDLRLRSDVRLGVGVDRLDYTKGIAEKFVAIEHLLEIRPDLRGRFVFVQVAEPSRASYPRTVKPVPSPWRPASGSTRVFARTDTTQSCCSSATSTRRRSTGCTAPPISATSTASTTE